MVETEKKYTARKTIKKRIEHIEGQIVGHAQEAMFIAILGGLESMLKLGTDEDVEAQYKSMMSSCKAWKVETSVGSNGLSTEQYDEVVEYVDKHEGRPETWSDAQTLLYNMANRPSKSGNITNIKKGKEHARNKIINALARAVKNGQWNIGNKTIKAPATPPKEKTVIIQEVPKEGA